MAIQIPSLIFIGVLAGKILQANYPKLISFSKQYRVSLLLYLIFTLVIWMLPLTLDLALHRLDVTIIKWLSLPLAGMALVISWPHLPFVLRGVLHVEAIATLLRLGWLYLIAPERYCVSYLIGDQVILGYTLLLYGFIYMFYLGFIMLFGTKMFSGAIR
jgi:hypothetical protein